MLSPPPTIRVAAAASIAAKPDRAEIDCGVVTQASLSREAAAENAKQVSAVLAALRELALENFDGIGAFRTTENDSRIDSSSAFDGKSVAGAAGLSQALAADPATTQCVVKRALEYATGHPTQNNAPTLASLHQKFATSGYRIRTLFQQVATLPSTLQISPVSEPGNTPRSAMLTTH